MTDNDDEEWDRWMALTEAEQDAELRRANEELDRVTAAMTLAQNAAALRRMAVANCLAARRVLALMDLPTFREGLRQSQRSLLKIREYRKTGIYPGGDQ
jgi:hypothetical protein